MKVSWKFYLQRKKKSLVELLANMNSLDEAKAFFDKIDISPPSDQRIISALEEIKALKESRLVKEKERNAVPKKTVPRSVRKTDKKKADASRKSKTSKSTPVKVAEESNEKYFRKVVPKRKK